MNDVITEVTTERSESDWEAIVTHWKTSGETQRKFYKRHQLSYSTFGYWSRKLKKQYNKTGHSQFVPLTIKPSTTEVQVSCLHIRLSSGIEVSVPSGHEKTQLKHLLESIGLI